MGVHLNLPPSHGPAAYYRSSPEIEPRKAHPLVVSQPLRPAHLSLHISKRAIADSLHSLGLEYAANLRVLCEQLILRRSIFPRVRYVPDLITRDRRVNVQLGHARLQRTDRALPI